MWIFLFFMNMQCYCQTPGQEQQEPSPKSVRRGCTRSLKFWHKLLMAFDECRELGVQRTHVRRKTRTTKRTFNWSLILQTKSCVSLYYGYSGMSFMEKCISYLPGTLALVAKPPQADWNAFGGIWATNIFCPLKLLAINW